MSTKINLKNINFERGYLIESEVNLIKTRMNRGALKHADLPWPDDGFKLSSEQTQKGLSWLMDQWKTPRGIERKSNPFGYREQAVLENFAEFRLVDFHDSTNYYAAQQGIHFYLPVYLVVAKDGSTFEYYVSGGQPSIIG